MANFHLMKHSSGFSLLFILALSNIICCHPTANTMTSNPTIVLVPGAFHVDSAMDVLAAQLEQAGYNIRTKGLISVNRPGTTVKDDSTALLAELLEPLIVQQGKDVVLYLHSYAGFPGSAAIGGLSKKERTAKGQNGGIVGLIYQSAFVPKLGDTLVQMIGGSYAPWQSPDVRLASSILFTRHAQCLFLCRRKPGSST